MLVKNVNTGNLSEFGKLEDLGLKGKGRRGYHSVFISLEGKTQLDE